MLKHRRFEALGVSIGPFASDSAAERVRSTLSHVDRLVVRDAASLERLQSLQIPGITASLGGDLAALSGYIRAAHQKSDFITVCPSAAAGTPLLTLQQQLHETLAHYQRMNGRLPYIVLLSLSSDPASRDVEICRALARSLLQSRIAAEVQDYNQLGLQRTCGLISSSVMVWSQRLHGAIAAYLSDVPFILIGHHQKCHDFVADVGAPLGSIVDEHSSWAGALEQRLTSGDFYTVPPVEYRKRAQAAYSSLRT